MFTLSIVRKSISCVIKIVLFLVVFQANSQNQLEIATTYYDSKKYDLTLKKLNQILLTDAKNRDALLLKISCKIEQQQNNEALDLILVLQQNNPQDGDVLFLKAFTEWRLGRNQTAMKSLTQALEYQPDNKFAIFLAGILYYELNLHAVAKNHFDQANDVSNELTPNHFSKKRLLKTYKSIYTLQHRVFELLTQNETQNYRIWFYKGLFKAISNDNWSAILDLEKSIEINQHSELPHFYKGYTFATIKKYDKALEHITHFHSKSENKYNTSDLIHTLKKTLEISNVIYDGVSDKPVLIAEKMPKFGVEESDLQKYLASNIIYPNLAAVNGVEGTVVVSFVIDSKGFVTNPTIVKPIGSGCDVEAMRVVKNMPKWIPGSQNGKVVSVKLTIPIKFRLF